jgi:PAS domain S-box-containing protein
VRTIPFRRPDQSDLVTELRARLEESEATLHAIRNGGVDALVVAGRGGPRVFTLEGAEHSYRVLIESMNEGALMLTPGALILYANRRFSTMIGQPLSRVLGGSFHQFLSEADRATLKRLLHRVARPVSTIQVLLHAAGEARVPVQVSVQRLAGSGSGGAAFSMVVTDMTEARRNERTLRRLTHSLLQSQESDRSRLALELHDRAARVSAPSSSDCAWCRGLSPRARPGCAASWPRSADWWAARPTSSRASRRTCVPASWESWAWSPRCAPRPPGSRNGPASPPRSSARAPPRDCPPKPSWCSTGFSKRPCGT